MLSQSHHGSGCPYHSHPCRQIQGRDEFYAVTFWTLTIIYCAQQQVSMFPPLYFVIAITVEITFTPTMSDIVHHFCKTHMSFNCANEDHNGRK